MRLALMLLAGTASIAASSPATAIDFGVDLFAEAAYTDNTTRVERNKESEVILTPGIAVAASHAGPDLNLDLDYSVERQIYQEDFYSDETVSTGTADLLWNALPNRLDLNINHSRTQSARRAAAVDTPNNRQEITNTSAGPTLRFNPRGEDELQFQFMYGDRKYSETDTDSTTETSTARYILQLSPLNSLTLQGSRSDVEYDNQFIPDLEYETVQATWARQTRDVTLSLMGGRTSTKRTMNRDDVDGGIGELSIDWALAPGTSLNITGARDIRDQAEQLSSGGTIDDQLFDVNSGFGEVFYSTRAEVSLSHEFNSTNSLELGVFSDDEDFDDALFDQESRGATLTYTRQLNRAVLAGLNLGVSKQDFSDENDEKEIRRAGIFTNWSATRSVSFDFEVAYRDEDNKSPLFSRTYDEWRGVVRVTYTPLAMPER
jgi:hypothetical protein